MLDWDDLRFFLALSRHGSLSAAAKELHVAQSTVGRRLASLEASLGVRLLNRTPEGYVPTQAGDGVRAHAERLETEAVSLERDVGGRDVRMAGLVRVSSGEAIATHILAPCLASLQGQQPDIMIELVPNVREPSLSMREADVSVRLKQPEQHDLVVRRIGNIAFGLYASADYLERRGEVDFEGGCPGHHLVTQSEDIEGAVQAGWLTDRAPRARVAIQTCSHDSAMAAAIQGGGLACLARFRADGEPALRRVILAPLVPPAGLWLVVHRDNRQTPRIRAVLTYITDHVRHMASLLCPADVVEDISQTMPRQGFS